MNLRLVMLHVLFLALLMSAPAQPILRLDFNDRSGSVAADTLPGFTSFVIGSDISSTTAQTNPTVRAFGVITVTISGTGVNPGYNDFQRSDPLNNSAFTESLLLRDFVQSNSQIDNGGLNVSIAGLASNCLYAVTIWSFDSISGGRRVSDWFANGELKVNNYTFDGRVFPDSNDDCRLIFYARSDARGHLAIAGRRDSSSVGTGGSPDFGVFLNALQLEPIFRISSVERRGGALVLGVDSPQPTQTHRIEQSATLRPGSWSDVTSAAFTGPTNGVLTATIPNALPPPRFYRVRR